jgi:hypothetical protein
MVLRCDYHIEKAAKKTLKKITLQPVIIAFSGIFEAVRPNANHITFAKIFCYAVPFSCSC